MLKDGLSCKNSGFLQNFQIRVSHGPPVQFAKPRKIVTMFLMAFANFPESEVPLNLRSVGSTEVPMIKCSSGPKMASCACAVYYPHIITSHFDHVKLRTWGMYRAYSGSS